MSESQFGREDARGNWVPDKPISYGPAFAWPPQPKALLKWFFGLPGYLLPWNIPEEPARRKAQGARGSAPLGRRSRLKPSGGGAPVP